VTGRRARAIPGPRSVLLGAAVVLIASSQCRRKMPDPVVEDLSVKPGDQVPVTGGQVVVHLRTEPAHLNTLVLSDLWATRVSLHMIHETLVREDPRTYEYVPGLAERWEITHDERGNPTYTFHLRRGVRWHDGKPFTSRDVMFTFDKLFDPEVRAHVIRPSFEPYVDSYEAPDDHTFRIVCKKTYYAFLTAIDDLPILPLHAMADGDLNTHERNRRPVGTGPYKFASWKAGRKIVLARNPEYWGETGYVDRIVYLYVQNPPMAAQLARKGRVDFIDRVHRPEAIDEEFRTRFREVVDQPVMLSMFVVNHGRELFRDVRVRRALAQLFDADSVLRKLVRGRGSRTTSLYYPKLPSYHGGLAPHPFDPEGAARLLDQAGWTDSDADGVRDRDGESSALTLLVPLRSRLEKYATVYQEALRKVGIRVHIAKLEWPVINERLQAHDFDMLVLTVSWPSPHMDPYELLHGTQRTKGGANYANYADAKMDSLLEAMRVELDAEKRRQIDLRIQELAHQEVVYIPLFNYHVVGMAHRRIRGVEPSAEWYQLDRWWIPKRLQRN